MFKYVDGVESLSDVKLPFLVDLPNGSCEAVFLIASKNAESELVPIYSSSEMANAMKSC